MIFSFECHHLISEVSDFQFMTFFFFFLTCPSQFSSRLLANFEIETYGFDFSCGYITLAFFHLFFKYLIEGKLLNNVVLVSAMQQCESAINVHISPPS